MLQFLNDRDLLYSFAAVGILILACLIYVLHWLTAPARYIRKAQRIGRLWHERQIYRATLERQACGSSYAGVLRALIESIDQDLESLGIPRSMLE